MAVRRKSGAVRPEVQVPRARATRVPAPPTPTVWKLTLYVAGQTPKSSRAFANLTTLCEKHLQGRYLIQVIDLLEHPHLARGAQIIAVPTLVVSLPDEVRQIIGDLSDTERALVGLSLQPVG